MSCPHCMAEAGCRCSPDLGLQPIVIPRDPPPDPFDDAPPSAAWIEDDQDAQYEREQRRYDEYENNAYDRRFDR